LVRNTGTHGFSFIPSLTYLRPSLRIPVKKNALKNLIRRLGDTILDGKSLGFSEAVSLLAVNQCDLVDLFAAANRVRHQFLGDQIEFCTIINAKSGRCSEDCRFCAQSAHYTGTCETYAMLPVEDMLAAALDASRRKVQRFSIVTSGRTLSRKDLKTVCTASERIREKTPMLVDCSLGFLSADQAKALKEAGIDRYHHNLETAASFFEKVCTTHTFSEKLATISRVKEAGMSICCGGIMGLGETPEQWLELVFQLRDLEVDCIPVNILNARPGTPLEQETPRPPHAVLKMLAITRLIVPRAEIRLAGGREVNLRDLQSAAFWAGVSGMIVGGYLTTPGRSIEEDNQLIRDLGLIRVQDG